MEHSSFKEKYLQAPRLTTQRRHFDDVSNGAKQIPSKAVVANKAFLGQDDELERYHSVYQRNMGVFWKHYCASVPFLVEEQCRIGLAISQFARWFRADSYFTFYETSSADGTDARTLAEFAQGLILTLTDSPNQPNKQNFYRLCSHEYSKFYLGSFIDVTPYLIASRPDFVYFQDGFDIIYENTTFQFYGRDRVAQIGHVSQLLKKNGIVFFLEKLHLPDMAEYEKREELKDNHFKSTFFSENEIVWKKEKMLSDMERCQVTFDELIFAISQHFKYIYLIWNSANFYELAASNSDTTIEKFCLLLLRPFVPEIFRFEGDLNTPKKLK
jgi:hypothetical protein